MQVSRTVDPEGQGRACCNLGALHYKQGHFEEAVMYLEKFYELSRSINDRKMLDVARINLGMARMAFKFPQYVEVRARWNPDF